MMFKLSILLLLGCLVSACGIHETKNVPGPSEAAALTANPSTQITYAEVNQLIIAQSCLSCHGASNPRGGVQLTTYPLVSSFIEDMKADIDSGDMPQNGALSSAQIALFDQWYAQGHSEFGDASEASASPTPFPTPTPVLSTTVTFAQVNQAVFQASCTTCHSGSSPSAGIALDSYANISQDLSEIKSTISSGSMPRNGTLTTTQKTLFNEWVAEGAPSN